MVIVSVIVTVVFLAGVIGTFFSIMKQKSKKFTQVELMNVERIDTDRLEQSSMPNIVQTMFEPTGTLGNDVSKDTNKTFEKQNDQMREGPAT